MGGSTPAPSRPQLTDAQAAVFSYATVLRGWDPIADAEDAQPDVTVEAGGPFPTVQSAVSEASSRAAAGKRVHILVKPGTYREIVEVPKAAVPITIYGAGPDASAVRIEGDLDASLKGTAGSATVRIANDGFQAKNLTFANTFKGFSQAVALLVDDADRVHLDNVRFEGFQDTLYLKATSPEKPARVFVHKSYVEGDVDFIFGEATAYFLDTEVRSLGRRTFSYALAPSTHVRSRFGFVFERCAFTHDGSPNALAGKFKLARQWFRGGSVEAVGKVAVLNSRIGAHIDKARPWADWGVGTARFRPVQYDANGEIYLAEYRNADE